MTEEEQIEWDHIYQTRLGILCLPMERPTADQRIMAAEEANQAVLNMRPQFTLPGMAVDDLPSMPI